MNDIAGGYPNREHEHADKGARRRASKALDDIIADAGLLRKQLDADSPTLDGDSAQGLADSLRRLTTQLSAIAALREVREWHAADLAAAE